MSPVAWAMTTTFGIRRYGLASDAYRIRSIGRVSTRSSPSSATRSARSGSGVPLATDAGAASGYGPPSGWPIRVMSGASRSTRLEHRHPGRDAHLDELRPARRDRGAQRLARVVSRGRLDRVDAVGGGELRRLELRQVESGRARHLLESREPLEDRVLLVAQDEHCQGNVVCDGAPERLHRVLHRAFSDHA